MKRKYVAWRYDFPWYITNIRHEKYRRNTEKRNCMRDKLYRFMQGRNGMDELARMQSWLVLILLLVGMFTRIGLFSFVALILMIYMYFRVFSRNTSNVMKKTRSIWISVITAPYRGIGLKTHGTGKGLPLFKCPMCKQEVRVPRGHGKIEITCPKCREKFIRRT